MLNCKTDNVITQVTVLLDIFSTRAHICCIERIEFNADNEDFRNKKITSRSKLLII